MRRVRLDAVQTHLLLVFIFVSSPAPEALAQGFPTTAMDAAAPDRSCNLYAAGNNRLASEIEMVRKMIEESRQKQGRAIQAAAHSDYSAGVRNVFSAVAITEISHLQQLEELLKDQEEAKAEFDLAEASSCVFDTKRK